MENQKEEFEKHERLGRLKSVLLDDDFKTSSKRLIGITAFFLMVVAYIIGIFVDVSLKEFMWDGMLIIVIGAFGFSALEKFAKKLKNE